jgi:hypothetical protein
LGVSESGNEPAINDREDGPLGFDGGVGGLIEDAPHLAVALRATTAVVHARALSLIGAAIEVLQAVGTSSSSADCSVIPRRKMGR